MARGILGIRGNPLEENEDNTILDISLMRDLHFLNYCKYLSGRTEKEKHA